MGFLDFLTGAQNKDIRTPTLGELSGMIEADPTLTEPQRDTLRDEMALTLEEFSLGDTPLGTILPKTLREYRSANPIAIGEDPALIEESAMSAGATTEMTGSRRETEDPTLALI